MCVCACVCLCCVFVKVYVHYVRVFVCIVLMCMQLCGLRVCMVHIVNTSQLENLKRAYSKVMEKRDEGKLTSISQVVQQEFLLGAELAGYTCTDIRTHLHT